MRKRLIIMISILFYAGMLFMTYAARPLHEAGLPHVTVLELEYGLFTDENGEEVFGVMLPKKWFQEGELYKIAGERVNDEYRTIAKRVDSLEIGLENEDYYQVKNGLGGREQIIIGGLEGVVDGGEVYIVGENVDGEEK